MNILTPKVIKEFYERYKDKSPEEIHTAAFNLGAEHGLAILKQLNIEGNDVNALKELLKAVVGFDPLVSFEVDDEGLHLRSMGFCTLMTTCLSLNLPWGWMCQNLGRSFFKGMASLIDPSFDVTIPLSRYKGDPFCDHIFKLTQR